MSWLDAGRARLRLLFRRGAAESRMREEIGLHLDLETERLRREEGLAGPEARRRALAAFGGVERHKETLRAERGAAWFTGLSLDLKLGARMLARYPGLTLVAVLALGLAIAAGATYLNVISTIYRPTLPLPDGDRLVGLYRWHAAEARTEERLLADLATWRTSLRSVEDLGAFRTIESNITGTDSLATPEHGAAISAAAFRLAGARPLLGRSLLDGDEAPGAPPTIVLSEALWQRRFGGDAAIVGRTVRVGGTVATVAGVMPAGYTFPVNHEYWIPLVSSPGILPGEGPQVKVFGRLAPGHSVATAQAELDLVDSRQAGRAPRETLRSHVEPFVPALLRPAGGGALPQALLYSVNLLFLGLLGLCGANVATLVHSRTVTREAELSIRTALGAARRRIVTQLFAEALLLTVAASGLGLFAAWYAERWIRQTIVSLPGSPPLPFWWNGQIAPVTLLYTAGMALVAALLIGVVPAVKATGPRLQARLRQAGAGGSTTRFGSFWTGIIVAQVALTVLFLFIVATIAWNIRGGRYGTVELRFPAAEYLTARLERDDATTVSSATLIQRLREEPGVRAVAYASALPGGDAASVAVGLDAAGAASPANDRIWVHGAAVGADFFTAFQATLRDGRTFDGVDVETGAPVVVVDRTFVDEVLHGSPAVGRRIHLAEGSDGTAPGTWYTIIGVVSDLTGSTDKAPGSAMIYRPSRPDALAPLHLAIRHSGNGGVLIPRVRQIALGVDPALRLHALMPMDERDRPMRMALTALTTVLAVAGALAVLLSTTGIYALMSFTVARRTREIGIRVAIGAAPRRVIAGVFGRSLGQLGLGVLAGSIPGVALVGWGAPEVARGAGVRGALATLVVVGLFAMLVGLAAGWVPMRRALRIEPVDALRVE